MSVTNFKRAINVEDTFAVYMQQDKTERDVATERVIGKVVASNYDENTGSLNHSQFRQFLDKEAYRMSSMSFMQIANETLEHTLTILTDYEDGTDERTDQEKDFIANGFADEVVYAVIETVISAMKQAAMQEMLMSLFGGAEDGPEEVFDIEAEMKELFEEANKND